MLKICCITFGVLGLVVGSILGYLQMTEENMNKTGAVQVQTFVNKNGTTNGEEDDNHDNDIKM